MRKTMPARSPERRRGAPSSLQFDFLRAAPASLPQDAGRCRQPPLTPPLRPRAETAGRATLSRSLRSRGGGRAPNLAFKILGRQLLFLIGGARLDCWLVLYSLLLGRRRRLFYRRGGGGLLGMLKWRQRGLNFNCIFPMYFSSCHLLVPTLLRAALCLFKSPCERN